MVVRFNSIGDIVLTTPVLEILSNADYEVHYLMKAAYSAILSNNPFISKIWTFNNRLEEVIPALRKENFDHIIDLHSNYRSWKIKNALNVKSHTFKKSRIRTFLMVHLGIWRKPKKHITDKFVDTIRPLVNVPHNYRCRYHLSKEDIKLSPQFDIPDSSYYVVAVGAAFHTKTIPPLLLASCISAFGGHCILIGGKEDLDLAVRIESEISKEVHLYNLTGKLTIDESALIMNQADFVISGDTGMLHIANALNKSAIAVYGSTHPMLGYTPFNDVRTFIIQNEDLGCRPCTKQGRQSCPKGHFKCMRDLRSEEIVEKMMQLI